MLGRPPRVSDPHFAQRVRDYMKEREMSIRALALVAGVQASTISRSLSDEAFSEGLRLALMREMGRRERRSEAVSLLRNALLKMRAADRMRAQAQALIQRALDQIERNEYGA